jgi:hypothetical protein
MCDYWRRKASASESQMWSDITNSISFHVPELIFEKKKLRKISYSEIS